MGRSKTRSKKTKGVQMKSEKEIKKLIKKICKENKHIKLNVVNNEICWTKGFETMTPKDWKHIGYVAGLIYSLGEFK